MATPIIGDLIQSTVGKVVGKLADHYLPASMSETEKETFRLKAQELALEEVRLAQASVESVNATMREEAKSEHWAQWLWRPMVGFTFSGVIINNYILLPYASRLGFQNLPIPGEVWSAMLVILGVAAGTRGWQKVKEAGGK